MHEALEDRIVAFQQCVERRDVARAGTILAPDYALVLVRPARTVMPRDQWLALLPDYHVHSYEIHEQHMDVDGDCAAVLHRATMKAMVRGQDRSGEFIVSDVWRLRDATWRLWRRHSTPITAGELAVQR